MSIRKWLVAVKGTVVLGVVAAMLTLTGMAQGGLIYPSVAEIELGGLDKRR